MTFTYSATAITVPGIILPAKNLPNVVHIQNKQKADDGTVTIYNGGRNEWYWEVNVRCNESQKTDLFSFIIDTILFSTHAFTLAPGTGVDLGAGSGTNFDCRYWGDELPVEISRGGGLYTFSFILYTSTAGSARPAA